MVTISGENCHHLLSTSYIVKCGVLTLIGEKRPYRNDHYHYYDYYLPVLGTWPAWPSHGHRRCCWWGGQWRWWPCPPPPHAALEPETSPWIPQSLGKQTGTLQEIMTGQEREREKEEVGKEAPSIRWTLELLQKQRWANIRETGWSTYGLFRVHRYHLELKWDHATAKCVHSSFNKTFFQLTILLAQAFSSSW